MKKIAIVILCAVIAGIAIYGFWGRTKKPSYEYAAAERKKIIQEVSAVGKVKPAQSVDLAFEKSGKVTEVLADVGSKIKAGQILIRLDASELSSQLLQAQAALEIEQVKLDEMLKGTRPEEIQKAQVAVSSAQKVLDDAQKNLAIAKSKAETDLNNLYDDIPEILQDAFTKADDAINNQISALFINADSNNPQLSFQISNLQVKSDAEWQRLIAGNELKILRSELSDLSNHAGLEAKLVKSESRLTAIRDLLVRLIDALNAGVGLLPATLNAYKTDVNTGRININAALVNIVAQKQAIENQKLTNQNNIMTAEIRLTAAENELAAAEASLDILRAGAVPEQVKVQEARVKSAQASVQNYQTQIAKTVLHSPIGGIVARQDAKVGQIAAAQTVIASVISAAKFQIEADIPEADIVKLKIGAPAEIALPAFPRQSFAGKIIFIGKAEKVIAEVIYYEVKIAFDEDPPEGIKPAMTADVIIQAEAKEDALVVPREAVRRVRGETVVEVPVNGLIQEKEVETGLRSDTMIEILSGLNEGEKVIIR